MLGRWQNSVSVSTFHYFVLVITRVGYNVTSTTSSSDKGQMSYILEGVNLVDGYLTDLILKIAKPECPMILQLWSANGLKYSLKKNIKHLVHPTGGEYLVG